MSVSEFSLGSRQFFYNFDIKLTLIAADWKEFLDLLIDIYLRWIMHSYTIYYFICFHSTCVSSGSTLETKYSDEL